MTIDKTDTQKAMEALQTGQDPMSAVHGEETDSVEDPQPSDTVEETSEADASTLLDDWASAEDAAQDTAAEEPKAESDDGETAEAKTEETAEVKEPTDADKLASKVKNYHKGMRKFQRERDKARKEVAAMKEEIGSLKNMWSKIETAANRNDYNELMKIMTAGKTDFDSLLKQKIEREQLRANATEEEVAQMDLQERINDLENKLAQNDNVLNEKLDEVNTLSEKAELAKLQSMVNPAFHKYSFEGKLGDPDLELRMNKILWNDARANLASYDDVDEEVIEQEFRNAAEILGMVADKKAKTQVKQTTKKRAEEAKKTAQVQQVRGYVSNDLKREAAEKIRESNYVDILKNWNKFGKLFQN